MKTNRTVVGVDTAKRVFQLHWVDMETGEVVDLKLTRAKFLEHFANRMPCVVAMEACGGSQHWATPASRARPRPVAVAGQGGATLRVWQQERRARTRGAIWTAAQMPGIRTIAVKSEEQQGILALHRMRQQLVKFPHRADQRAARSSDRIRRGDAAGPEPACAVAWPMLSPGSRNVCRRW